MMLTNNKSGCYLTIQKVSYTSELIMAAGELIMAGGTCCLKYIECRQIKYCKIICSANQKKNINNNKQR